MNIFYKRVLNLTIGHNYFKDGADRFIMLFPTAETGELLQNAKMLFKRLPNGITLLYRTLDDETTPFVELEKDQHFLFVIKSSNVNGFLNITDLDEAPNRTFKSGNIVYFRNNPANASNNKNNPEILTHEIIDSLRGPLFTYQFTINANPSSVRMIVTDSMGNPVSVGKDAGGNSLPKNLSLAISENQSFSQQIDLRELQKGRYVITIRNAEDTATLKTEKIYVDGQLEMDNIVGIVDLVYDSVSDHLYGNTEEFKLQFNATKTFWKFYIVNKSKNIDLSTESLTINDLGTPNGSPYKTNLFRRVFASIELTAKTTGTAGNTITLNNSGSGDFQALSLSGETLAGGTSGAPAKGIVTVVNNEATGYTIKIGGTDLTEGTHFAKGTTSSATALALVTAINSNAGVEVTAAMLNHDVLVNDFKTLVFASTEQIPFFEIPKLKLELRKTSDNQAIVANLPNPTHNGIRKFFAGQPESEVYVFI